MITEILSISHEYYALSAQVDEVKALIGKAIANQVKSQGVYKNIHDAEFKVFSQFGDDGIIQYLINNIEIDSESQTFVEFGCENYIEANTRFLLINNNWRGLVIDASETNIKSIKQDAIYWKHALIAIHSFITRDNINQIISSQGFSGELGILSIDIDGNDYWIWECINVVNPILAIVEYNSILGDEYAITVPYDPDFRRTKAHASNLFFGSSLKALYHLAESKGYFFVGSNSAGNNAYFVRKDKIGKINPVTVEEGYVESRFRDSVDSNGQFSYISGKQRLKVIDDLTVYDIEKKRLIKIRDLFV
jgi:hypothetical protein